MAGMFVLTPLLLHYCVHRYFCTTVFTGTFALLCSQVLLHFCVHRYFLHYCVHRYFCTSVFTGLFILAGLLLHYCGRPVLFEGGGGGGGGMSTFVLQPL